MTARRVGALAATTLVLLVLLTSHRIGRAEPTGDYRPGLPPDGLAAGCYPLPGGASFDFGYLVRRDGDFVVDGEARRVLLGQYVELDEPEALTAIVGDFVEAGFVRRNRPVPPYDAVLRRPSAGRDEDVQVVVTQLPGIEDDTLVRGTFALVMPVAPADPDGPALCDQESVTKRWDLTTWLLGW